MLRAFSALLVSALLIAPRTIATAQEAEASSEGSTETRAEAEREPADWEGTWTLYGASLGRHIEGDTNGYSVGIELSDVHLFRYQLWYGYYADLRYSSLARGVDLSVGVEAGVSVIGVDLGLYARVGGESAIGFRARGCVSAIAVVSICGGGGYTNRGGFVEASLLLKYGRRRGRQPEPEEVRSDADADAEARRDDEAPARAIEFPMADEGMFILEAPFQEGVDAAEPSDGVAAEDEAAADVLDAEPGASPEVVEPAEVDAVEQR